MIEQRVENLGSEKPTVFLASIIGSSLLHTDRTLKALAGRIDFFYCDDR